MIERQATRCDIQPISYSIHRLKQDPVPLVLLVLEISAQSAPALIECQSSQPTNITSRLQCSRSKWSHSHRMFLAILCCCSFKGLHPTSNDTCSLCVLKAKDGKPEAANKTVVKVTKEGNQKLLVKPVTSHCDCQMPSYTPETCNSTLITCQAHNKLLIKPLVAYESHVWSWLQTDKLFSCLNYLCSM